MTCIVLDNVLEMHFKYTDEYINSKSKDITKAVSNYIWTYSIWTLDLENPTIQLLFSYSHIHSSNLGHLGHLGHGNRSAFETFVFKLNFLYLLSTYYFSKKKKPSNWAMEHN